VIRRSGVRASLIQGPARRIRRLVKLVQKWCTIPRGAWRTSTSRPLFLSPVTNVSFVPERYRIHWGGKRAINCGDRRMSSNCPNWLDRHFFLRVLIGISYGLRTFGILRPFSDGIRPGNAGRLQLGGKLTHYSWQGSAKCLLRHIWSSTI
jgi:hypothetical protein